MDWAIPLSELEETDEDLDYSLEVPDDFHIYNEKFGYFTVAEFYRDEVHSDYQIQQPEPLTYDEVIKQTSSPDDHKVAEDLVSQLDPVLLQLAQHFMSPQVDSSSSNKLRLSLIQAFEQQIQGVSSTVRSVRLEPRGSDFVLLDTNADVLVRGSYFEVVEYCHHYFPSELKYLLSMSEKYSNKILSGSIDVMLKNSRAIRRLSPLLDKISKFSQLPFAESDHPVFRYNDGDLEEDELELPRYAVNEDPIIGLRTRIDSYMTREEFLAAIDLPRGVYYVNCVIGDSIGSCGNDKSLFDRCLSISHHSVVQAFVYLDNLELPRSFLVNKSRPHNLAATIEINKDGQSGKALMKGQHNSVLAANIVRNSRLFGKFKYTNKLESVSPETIDKVIANFWRYRPRFKKEVLRPVRKKICLRRLEMEKIGGDRSFKFSYELPNARFTGVELISSVLHNNDTGQLSPEVALRSLGLLALKQGHMLVYLDGCWQVKFKKKH